MDVNLTCTDKVIPMDLPALLTRYSGKIDILSLDCFDTLLWRMTANPSDLFLKLQQASSFREINLSAQQRIHAESTARRKKLFLQNTSEVTLEEIYQACCPQLSHSKLHSFIEDEIIAEISMSYAFQPMVDLIRIATEMNIKIIIVSDTYFNQHQLSRLLQHALPEDLYNKINNIFCSVDIGKSKINGLFTHVVQSLRCGPDRILHIGDNFSSDYIPARTVQINALHFIPFNDYITQLMRLETMAAKIMDPQLQTQQPLTFPCKPILSTKNIAEQQPEMLIGYASLGPIMYAFAHFILDEINQLHLEQKRPKPVFLLRDAHLPELACAALLGESLGPCVAISRFASLAASFTTNEDILNYLLKYAESDRFLDIANQLLLPAKVSEPIIRKAQQSEHPTDQFIKSILQPHIIDIILQKSAKYRTRLFCYLEKQITLTEGDTLVFIDLGYSGSTQRHLTPLLKEKNINVEGRYLIATQPISPLESRRVGLLDSTMYDSATLSSLVNFFAIIEQLCTSNGKSVIDYDKEGNPIYTDIHITGSQNTLLNGIQNQCIDFIKDAKHYFANESIPYTQQQWRDFTLAELGRMIYFPTPNELRHLESFQFDLNLGTKDIYQLFDPQQGLKSLKKKGIIFH